MKETKKTHEDITLSADVMEKLQRIADHEGAPVEAVLRRLIVREELSLRRNMKDTRLVTPPKNCNCPPFRIDKELYQEVQGFAHRDGHTVNGLAGYLITAYRGKTGPLNFVEIAIKTYASVRKTLEGNVLFQTVLDAMPLRIEGNRRLS